jgi:hypothetical protein
MPGPQDDNKRFWHPVKRDWALAHELAFARRGCRDKTAWALLAQMKDNKTGDAFCDNGKSIEEALTNDLWGVYGDTDELALGNRRVNSLKAAACVLELLVPSVWTLRDSSPLDPICIHWRYVGDELYLDVFNVVKGQQKAMGLARTRGEKIVRRFQDNAGIKVSYIGPDLELANRAWCLHEMMLHHPYLSVVK